MLTHVLSGRTSKEIARMLRVSDLTVRKHRENLLRKLGLTSTAQLLSLAPKTSSGNRST